MGLPDAIKDTKKNTATNKGSKCTTEPCPKIVAQKKVGILLAFHPILFKKTENPAEQRDFSVLPAPEFEDLHLFADGRSEALIEVQLVRLNTKGQVDGDDLKSADASDHANEGTITLELDNITPGILKYRQQSGKKIDIVVADLVDGRTSLEKDNEDAVRYVTTTYLGEAKITTDLNGNASYEFRPQFKLPKKTKKVFSLKVGTRKLSQGSKGHDVMKYQWYLRRFGFLAYDERKVKDRSNENDWTSIREPSTDGDWGHRTGRCSRDFQLVARGAFRNQTIPNVPITFTLVPDEPAGGEEGAECAHWHDQHYKVDPYHGHIWINDAPTGGSISAHGKIVYGALIEGRENRGHLEVRSPIGLSHCHWSGQDLEVAGSVRTAVRLFQQDTLVFRLHDADRENQLDLSGFHQEMRRRTIRLLQTARRQHQADYTSAGNWDLMLYSTYRSVAEQNTLYAKGRDSNGHVIDATQVATDARGGSSWHNYGLAADIVFYTDTGGISESNQVGDFPAKGALGTPLGLFWGITVHGGVDRPHHQHDGIPSSPSDQILNTYNHFQGSDADKLHAVWTSLGV